MNNFIVVTIALVIGLLGTIGIEYLRPTTDNLPLLAAMFTFIVSVLAWLKSEQTHKSVNSQLSEWKAEVVGLAHAEGNIEGRKQEKSEAPTKGKL